MKTKNDCCRVLSEVWPIAKTTACQVGRAVGHAYRTVFGRACEKQSPLSPSSGEFPMFQPLEEETDFFQGCEKAFATPDHNAVEMERAPTEGELMPVMLGGEKETEASDEGRGTDGGEQSVPKSRSVEEPPAVKPTRSERNLDNKPWFGLMEEVIRLEGEIERLSPKLPEEARNFAEHIFARLEEILERNGAVAINETDCRAFSDRLHQPFPARVVKNGVPVAKVLTPGWRIEERVLRRAKVDVPETADVSGKPG